MSEGCGEKALGAPLSNVSNLEQCGCARAYKVAVINPNLSALHIGTGNNQNMADNGL